MREEETVPLILEYQNINNGKTTEFSVEHFNTQAAVCEREQEEVGRRMGRERGGRGK